MNEWIDLSAAIIGLSATDYEEAINGIQEEQASINTLTDMVIMGKEEEYLQGLLEKEADRLQELNALPKKSKKVKSRISKIKKRIAEIEADIQEGLGELRIKEQLDNHTAKLRQHRRTKVDVERFLNSEWYVTLCEGMKMDPDYIRAGILQIKKEG